MTKLVSCDYLLPFATCTTKRNNSCLKSVLHEMFHTLVTFVHIGHMKCLTLELYNTKIWYIFTMGYWRYQWVLVDTISTIIVQLYIKKSWACCLYWYITFQWFQITFGIFHKKLSSDKVKIACECWTALQQHGPHATKALHIFYCCPSATGTNVYSAPHIFSGSIYLPPVCNINKQSCSITGHHVQL